MGWGDDGLECHKMTRGREDGERGVKAGGRNSGMVCAGKKRSEECEWREGRVYLIDRSSETFGI